MKRHVPLSAAVVLVACTVFAFPLQARHEPSAAELAARIQREHHPIKKAKLEARLADGELKQAIAAYDQQQLSQGAGLLKRYLREVEVAWQTLQATGRDATKKPQGFMELEIRLREDMRELTDVRGRVYYADRGPVDQALNRLGSLHSEVLAVLFPSLHTNPAAQKNVSEAGLTPTQGSAHP